MEPYSIWSFCDWLISLRTTSLTQDLSLLLCIAEFLCVGWIVFHRMHRPHGGCFYILAAVNSAAMNMGVLIPLSYPDFNSFDKYPETGLPDYTTALCLIFWGASILFSMRLHFAFQHGVRGCRFPCILTSMLSGAVAVFDTSHPDRCEVILYCGLDLHFPDD